MAGMFDVMMGGQSGAASGWARGGAALGEAMGGGAGRNAYDEAMLRGHRVQKALADAQKASLEFQSMMDLQDQLEPLFGERAAAVAATLNAGHNLQQVMRGRESMYQGDALSEALEGVRGGSGIADVNPLLGVAHGRPVQTTKVEGNTIISPYEAVSAQVPQVSPFGAGRLRNDAARVAGQNAAAMVRATTPRASGGADTAARREYERVKKEAAQQILTEAKLAGRDTYGLTLADIVAQMDSGTVRDMSGNVIGRWDVTPEQFANPVQEQDFSNVRGAASDIAPSAAMQGATMPKTGITTAAPGAAVTDPQTRRTAASPSDPILGPSISDIVMDGRPAVGDTLAMPRPRNKAEYDALPSGTRFIAPDGKERIKP